MTVSELLKVICIAAIKASIPS